ncbi:MDR family oxidoreductase [Aquabacterium sp.]|uniref:acrylyl-CoA reductase (NADPH) n=1 Tax=Aquabacterium sp. TaxID=1872578 RepID=UPI002C2AD0C4|nr:MDR family oxidoreductase [Aquabacterium sp.]HSW08956.1 MDR family oxidoreductase [Aquabacterium sp.]
MRFQALLLSQTEDRKTHAELVEMDDARLPERAVTVDVTHSTLNYKDALAITGRGAVVRNWPLVPGIDLAGTVAASLNPEWQVGDAVVATGWGLGENHWGGLTQRQRLDTGWLLKIPAPFTPRTAMAVGTAGFTAAMCVQALQRHGLQPGDGEVLVTGAAGGVGGIAVALLAAMGYSVVASTGRAQEADYLQGLGAARIVDRNEFTQPGKPLQKEAWAGVVDTVGSHTLANACAATRQYGAVAACGLAQGGDFPSTVMPFILRGVTLYGINSVLVPNPLRAQAWALMARHLDLATLEAMSTEIGLSEVIGYAPQLIAGQVRGRTIVDVWR